MNRPVVAVSLAGFVTIPFVTNANGQSYAGESGTSQTVRAAGLPVQNCVSAATGTAVRFRV